MDRPIGKRSSLKVDVRMPDGPCELCGAGPLHGPGGPGVGVCGCSFIRDGRRLCRSCAGAVDLVDHGATRLLPPELALLLQRFDLVPWVRAVVGTDRARQAAATSQSRVPG